MLGYEIEGDFYRCNGKGRCGTKAMNGWVGRGAGGGRDDDKYDEQSEYNNRNQDWDKETKMKDIKDEERADYDGGSGPSAGKGKGGGKGRNNRRMSDVFNSKAQDLTGLSSDKILIILSAFLVTILAFIAFKVCCNSQNVKRQTADA